MIDHVTVPVRSVAKSLRGYLQALGPLGYEVIMELSREHIPELPATRIAGLGVKGKPDLWLRQEDGPINQMHVAFRAADHAAVDAFHAKALAAGMRDNGGPGPRPHYHEKYYGAFVLDADGHNIEAVCHD